MILRLLISKRSDLLGSFTSDARQEIRRQHCIESFILFVFFFFFWATLHQLQRDYRTGLVSCNVLNRGMLEEKNRLLIADYRFLTRLTIQKISDSSLQREAG